LSLRFEEVDVYLLCHMTLKWGEKLTKEIQEKEPFYEIYF
jgi:hypothetical protein